MSKPFEVICGGRSGSLANLVVLTHCGETDALVALCRLLDAANLKPTASPGLQGFGLVSHDARSELHASPAPFTFVSRRQDDRFCEDVSTPASQSEKTWSTLVASYKGVIRNCASSLNLRIIGATEENSALIREPMRIAFAEGRNRVAVAISRNDTEKWAYLESQIQSVYAGAASIERIEPAAAALRIARDDFSFGLLVASSHDAEIMEAVSHQLAGGGWMRAKTWHCENEIRSAAYAAYGCGPQDAACAETAIFAGAEILAACGRFDAARILKNALFRALDDNLHTASAPLAAPYTLKLSNVAFISAVSDRLGKAPTRISAAEYVEGADAALRTRRAPLLRLAYPA